MESRYPKLIRNCRLSESQAKAHMLVMPEGAIHLKGAGAEIISLCDGNRSIDQIFSMLASKYPLEKKSKLESEILDFLETLRNKRVLDF